ncbi:hypothetical protein HYT23_05990 [Candidatus Pacearchaeota archaeon]|nr:hypothetical protein [Candidatus Pacearchaeota archaeon]
MVTKEEVEFLEQIAESIKKAEDRMEIAYGQRNYDEFNRLKKFMLQIQQRISQVIR